MTAPRHERLAQQLAGDLGLVWDAIPTTYAGRAIERLAQYEQTIEADAVVYLHADRLTTEPTTFPEDRVLRPLLAEGEVAMALRPFPSGPGAVVLYGSREQIREILDAAAEFAEQDA